MILIQMILGIIFIPFINCIFDSCTIAEESEMKSAFDDFTEKYKKEYSTKDETDNRYNIFRLNYSQVQCHNNSGKHYKLGVNKFSDWSSNEFKKSVLMKDGLFTESPHKNGILFKDFKSSLLKENKSEYNELPESFDWRSFGVVSPVKNQGTCGSCWAFSSTSCLESHTAIKKSRSDPLSTKILPYSLSEQQLIDCSKNFGNFGCDGGIPAFAFEYIQAVGGIEGEREYPYEDFDFKNKHKCKYSKDKKLVSAPGGSVIIGFNDEEEIARAVVEYGPIAIAYHVSPDFPYYKSGVYSNPNCPDGPGDLDHAVLIVGFGKDEESKKDYWIIKNSWSEDWGESGYFKMEKGVNMCGVADFAAFPNVYNDNKKIARALIPLKHTKKQLDESFVKSIIENYKKQENKTKIDSEKSNINDFMSDEA